MRFLNFDEFSAFSLTMLTWDPLGVKILKYYSNKSCLYFANLLSFIPLVITKVLLDSTFESFQM